MTDREFLLWGMCKAQPPVIECFTVTVSFACGVESHIWWIHSLGDLDSYHLKERGDVEVLADDDDGNGNDILSQ